MVQEQEQEQEKVLFSFFFLSLLLICFLLLLQEKEVEEEQQVEIEYGSTPAVSVFWKPSDLAALSTLCPAVFYPLKAFLPSKGAVRIPFPAKFVLSPLSILVHRLFYSCPLSHFSFLPLSVCSFPRILHLSWFALMLTAVCETQISSCTGLPNISPQ
jgi:hypothetical protein